MKQRVWDYAKSLHKTNKKLKTKQIGVPKQKKYTQNKSRLNKVDCTQTQNILNSKTYYSFGGTCTLDSRVDDIFHGVSKLDLGGNSKPLSKVRLFNLINLKDILFLEDIQDYCKCEVRQARNYLKAVKLCCFYINRLYSCDNKVFNKLIVNNLVVNFSYISVAENCNFDNNEYLDDLMSISDEMFY